MKKNSMIIICFVMMFTLVGCDSGAETSNNPSGTSENSSTENTKKSYGLNEDVYITNSSGEYKFKITGISETSDRNEFSDKVVNRVIIISYEYENISLEDDLSIDDWNFKIYDKDNNVMETYPVDTKYGDSIGQGRKATATVAYALNNDSNYIEVEYYDNMFNSKSDCVFKLEW